MNYPPGTRVRKKHSILAGTVIKTGTTWAPNTHITVFFDNSYDYIWINTNEITPV